MRSRKTQIAIILCLLLLPLIGLTASAVLSSGSTNYFSIFVSSGGNTGGSGLLAKDVTEFSRLSDTHYGLQWSPPPGWAVSNVNITLSNITAPTYERVIEDYADQAVPLIQYNYTNPFQSLILAGIMSFNLTPGEPVYFNKLSLLLVKAPFNESAYVDIAIYNATYNSSLNWVVPDQPLWTVSNQSLIGDTLEFKNFSLTASLTSTLFWILTLTKHTIMRIMILTLSWLGRTYLPFQKRLSTGSTLMTPPMGTMVTPTGLLSIFLVNSLVSPIEIPITMIPSTFVQSCTLILITLLQGRLCRVMWVWK